MDGWSNEASRSCLIVRSRTSRANAPPRDGLPTLTRTEERAGILRRPPVVTTSTSTSAAAASPAPQQRSRGASHIFLRCSGADRSLDGGEEMGGGSRGGMEKYLAGGGAREMFGGRDGGDVASLVAAWRVVCSAREGRRRRGPEGNEGGASCRGVRTHFIEVAPTVPPHHV